PGRPLRIIVDRHQMGESPEYRKTGQFRLLDHNKSEGEERWDHERGPRGSCNAGEALLMDSEPFRWIGPQTLAATDISSLRKVAVRGAVHRVLSLAMPHS